MSDKEQITPAAVTPDTLEAFTAALARIRDVPPSQTLIDQISDEDWDADGSDWNIACGSEESPDDELDAVDADEKVAA